MQSCAQESEAHLGIHGSIHIPGSLETKGRGGDFPGIQGLIYDEACTHEEKKSLLASGPRVFPAD